MALEVDNWNADQSLITTVAGTDVSEGCLLRLLNDAIRKVMAAVYSWRQVGYSIDKNTTAQASGGAAPTSPAVGHLWMEW